MSLSSDPYYAGPPVRRYNQRMAQRMAKRAHVNEQGVAVCFAFNNLLCARGLLERRRGRLLLRPSG